MGERGRRGEWKGSESRRGGGKGREGRRGAAGWKVRRKLGEVIEENSLDISIQAGVAVVEADKLKAVLEADMVVVAVKELDGGVVAVLAAIQLDG